jgi:hypothetical protein
MKAPMTAAATTAPTISPMNNPRNACVCEISSPWRADSKTDMSPS